MKKMKKIYEAPMAEIIEFQPVHVLMASGINNGGPENPEEPSGSCWHGSTLDYETVDIP